MLGTVPNKQCMNRQQRHAPGVHLELAHFHHVDVLDLRLLLVLLLQVLVDRRQLLQTLQVQDIAG